jgi:hypothetical protein
VRFLLFPFHLLARTLVVSTKLVFATGEVAFRAGYAAGSLPVKGSAAAGRALGPKAVLALVVGLVLGALIGRELAIRLSGAPPAEPPSVPDLPDEVAVDV